MHIPAFEVPLHHPGDLLHDLEIQGGILGDAGTLHFHHHRFAGQQHRPMHLGDGSGAERLLFERTENVLDRRLEFRFHHLAQFFERDGFDLVLEFLQLVGEFLGQQAGAGGKQLAQLDEGRAQFLARAPESFRLRQLLDGRLFLPVLQEGNAANGRQADARSEVVKAVFQEDADDLSKALGMLKRASEFLETADKHWRATWTPTPWPGLLERGMPPASEFTFAAGPAISTCADQGHY